MILLAFPQFTFPKIVNSILTMGLPRLQSDSKCTTVSLLQRTQSKDSTICLVNTVDKN